MTALLYTLGVLLFAFGILASIGLHELGHMIPAKRFGGKVTEYFIGFGPTVWSRRRGETEYGLKAIPLGGYVKIVGMLPPDKAGESDHVEIDEDGHEVHTVRRSNTGLFTQLISDARSAEWDRITPEDEPRLFYRLPWWKKVIVMAGGPTVNLLIAFAIFVAIFATFGNPNPSDGEIDATAPRLETVSACVLPYDPEATAERTCTAKDPAAPAAEAGLRPGDTITSFNGTQVSSWGQLKDLIRANDDGDAVIGFVRDGREMEGRTSTTVEARPLSADDAKLVEVGFLGVSPVVPYPQGGPLYTVEVMGRMTVDTVKAIGTLPVKVWGVGRAVVGLQERDPESPVSIVGGGRIAGATAAEDRLTITEKVVGLGLILAGFNFFIGMFNFLPLLPLDGGHIAGALWEALRRGFARLRRRPDPGYVDVAKLLPIAYVFASVLLVMGVVLIIGDLVVPVRLS